MGFVDGDASELALIGDCLEMFAERLGEGVLWGDVEEAGKRMAWLGMLDILKRPVEMACRSTYHI